METQRHFHEPELGGLDPVWADLRLIEPDLAWFSPGEHIEETAERTAVRSPQTLEGLHRPAGAPLSASGFVSRCREPLRTQFPGTDQIKPDGLPGITRRVHLRCGLSAVFGRPDWCPSAGAAPRVCAYTPGRSSSPETGRTCRFVRPASLDRTPGRSQPGRHCCL